MAKTSKTSSERYEVVAGTRQAPGAVLATFSGRYACGGPATACLRWFAARCDKAPMFFRRVVA